MRQIVTIRSNRLSYSRVRSQFIRHVADRLICLTEGIHFPSIGTGYANAGRDPQIPIASDPADKRRAGRPILRCGPAAALRVIMNTMSEVAENAAVLDGLVRRIAERFAPDKIILFGSRARGDAAAGSDIDLLVLFSEVADPNQRAAELYASLVDFPTHGHRCFDQFPLRTLPERVNTVYWPASREGKTSMNVRLRLLRYSAMSWYTRDGIRKPIHEIQPMKWRIGRPIL